MKFEFNLPANSNRKRSIRPVAALHYGHLAPDIASGAIENLVRVAVLLGGDATVGM